MNGIYLDYNATTPLDNDILDKFPEVIAAMQENNVKGKSAARDHAWPPNDGRR